MAHELRRHLYFDLELIFSETLILSPTILKCYICFFKKSHIKAKNIMCWHLPIFVGVSHAGKSFQAKPGTICKTNAPRARGRGEGLSLGPEHRYSACTHWGAMHRGQGRGYHQKGIYLPLRQPHDFSSSSSYPLSHQTQPHCTSKEEQSHSGHETSHTEPWCSHIMSTHIRKSQVPN